jgi:hypothetical protein
LGVSPPNARPEVRFPAVGPLHPGGGTTPLRAFSPPNARPEVLFPAVGPPHPGGGTPPLRAFSDYDGPPIPLDVANIERQNQL